MDRDVDEAPCTSTAVDTTVRVAAAGVIWGLTSAPYDARKLGLTGFSRTKFLAKSTALTGLQCGFLAGIHSATYCRIQEHRMKKDWLNASLAGAVTGAVAAAGTRSWKTVFGLAALISSISTAAEILTGGWNPPG